MKAYQAHLKEHPINRQVEISCGLQFAVGSSYTARTIPISELVEAYQRGDVNRAHERVYPDTPVKFFVDIDRKDEFAEDNWDLFLRRAINCFSRCCNLSSDYADWTLVQTIYEDGSKFSVHMICNDGSMFKNATSVGRLIQQNMSMDEIREFHLDCGIYKSTMQLRVPGSAKWIAGQPDRVAIIVGPITNKHCTYLDYCRALISQRPSVGIRMVEVPGDSQEVIRFNEPVLNDEPRDQYVRLVLAKLEENPLNQALMVEGVGRGANVLTFRVPNLTAWRTCHCGVGCSIFYRTLVDVFVVTCLNEKCSAGQFEEGATPFAAHTLQQWRYMLWLHDHGLDRADMIIYTTGNQTFGHYDMTAGEFFAKHRLVFNCGKCDFCLDSDMELPPHFCDFWLSPRDNMLMTLETYEFLRNVTSKGDSGAEDRLAIYFNFYVCRSQVGDCFFVRGPSGLMPVKAHGIAASFARFQYDVEAKSKRDEDPKYVAKPFWPAYCQHRFGLRTFDSHNDGPLDFRPRSGLNMLPPKAVDSNKARLAFLQLDRPDQLWLLEMFDMYLEMAVAFESDSVQAEAKRCLRRWILDCLFSVAEHINICPIFVSSQGGQGKSTLGFLMQQILGPELSCNPAAKQFFADKFNKGTNGFVFLDEITLDHESAERLKEAITAPIIREEAKMQNARTVPSRRRIFGTSNRDRLPALAKYGNDRRFLVLRFLNVSTLDEKGIFEFECEACQLVDDCGDEIPCGHCIHGHAEWASKFYTHILSGVGNKFCEGSYFLPFVGALKLMHEQFRDTDFFRCPLQTVMPMTRAALEMQELSHSLVRQFIDFVSDRGYHSTMGAPVHFSGNRPPTVQFLIDAITKYASAKALEKPEWEEWVSMSQLYFEFQQWCAEQGITPTKVTSKENFLAELKVLHSLFFNSELKIENKICRALIFKSENAREEPDWKATSRMDSNVKCINMSKVPWNPPKSTAPVLRKSATLIRSDANLVMEEPIVIAPPRFRSPENTLLQMEAAEYQRPSILARAMEIGFHFGGSDAQDGFDPGFIRTSNLPDIQDLSDAEQDRRAGLHDVRAKKRFRAAAAAGIDAEAEVSDRSESEGGLMDDSD